MRIGLSAIVVQRLHASYADRNFGQPFTPGTTESICDDHRDGKVQSFFQSTMDSRGRTVGIIGQKKGVLASVNVGDVNSAVGADKSVTGFSNQHAAFAANDAAALLDGQLDDAGIEIDSVSPSGGTRRRV